MRRPFYFSLLISVGIAIDLLSKWLVFDQLRSHGRESYEFIPDILHITLAENKGVAFSWFKDSQVFILGVSGLAVAAIVFLYLKSWRTARAPFVFALGLLLTGAIGNLFDRICYGYVRDFIDFVPRIPLIGHWAIFNFADICITVGVMLFLFSEIFLQRPALQSDAKPESVGSNDFSR